MTTNIPSYAGTDIPSYAAKNTTGTPQAEVTTFTFHADPGHAWLEVTELHLAQVGLTPKDFTSCSFQELRAPLWTYYLEEDCDAGRFLDAWGAKFGKGSFEVRDEYVEVTPIRGLVHMPGGWSPFGSGGAA
jgi:hypothetical protein